MLDQRILKTEPAVKSPIRRYALADPTDELRVDAEVTDARAIEMLVGMIRSRGNRCEVTGQEAPVELLAFAFEPDRNRPCASWMPIVRPEWAMQACSPRLTRCTTPDTSFGGSGERWRANSLASVCCSEGFRRLGWIESPIMLRPTLTRVNHSSAYEWLRIAQPSTRELTCQ